MRSEFVRGFHWLMPVVALLDFLCLQAALLLGYWFWVTFPWHGNFQYFYDYAIVLWLLPPIGIVVFTMIDLYKPEMGVIGVREQSLIFKGIWILYLLGFAVFFFYREVNFSRLAVFYSIFIAIILISFERFWVRHVFEWLSQRDIGIQRALIFGAGYHGQRLERWIHQSPRLGIRIVGYLDDNPQKLVKIPVSPPILGQLSDLQRYAREKAVSLLFIAHRNLHENKVTEIFQICRRLKIRCFAIPALYQFHVEKIELQNIGGIPLVGLREPFATRYYLGLKRIFDVLVSLFLLCVTLPLSLFIMLILKLTSRDPVFFTQFRVGKGGRKFKMYKFRTLKSHAPREQISPELQGQKAGKRMDPFRSFLRTSGLDELPQLFNVFLGNMSLVGPRPEMPFLVQKYGPLERDRLRVKPGLTGLWQISDDRKRLLIHENMDYDLYYIEHLSFNLDLAILMKTFFAVLKRIGQFFMPDRCEKGPAGSN